MWRGGFSGVVVVAVAVVVVFSSRVSEAVERDRGWSSVVPSPPVVESGGVGVDVDVFCDCMYRTIFRTFPGLDDRVITVVTPAAVASWAATIFVPMPPVPREEPALDTISN